MSVAPMGVMVTVAAGTAFMRNTLAVHEISATAALVMRGISALATFILAATLVGVLGYRAGQTLVTVLGLGATLLVLPIAFLRARRGERVAQYLLFGWAFYIVGAFTAAGLLRGYIEPTAWAQHVYPLTMIVEMTAWMAVLGLRVQTIHRSADRARLEADALRKLAHTDALTGLPNRRGLQERLQVELQRCDPNRVLALFLLDLDGFKAVNDRWGHDVGDALLVEVSRRLQALLRGSDVVARLGGDEFVVVAAGLSDEGAAQRLGHKLLAAFDIPFDAAGQRCEVGLTAGYALAPHDGSTAEELIKRADAAMYSGKQAGRHCVRRGGRSLVAAA
jgi:diguanylate cyclase (GGDEF)-like protein